MSPLNSANISISEASHVRLNDTVSPKLMSCSLKSFGDYGVIIFALIEKSEKTWYIRSLLMSCRVFGRDVEDAFFMVVLQDATREGASSVIIDYEETEKNAPARAFIDTYFTGNILTIKESLESPVWITTHYEKI